MHELHASFILGYHGCDQAVCDRLLGGEQFQPSKNAYDWLGPGTYFWEANPRRGLEFAREAAARSKNPSTLTGPAVVGAVVNLGRCLDLTSSTGIELVQRGYRELRKLCRVGKVPIPANTRDKLRRNLDCAVIRVVHEIRERMGEPIDTVRGVFVEGKRAYKGAGFGEKTHVQICVFNPKCIKGVFRVKPGDLA